MATSPDIPEAPIAIEEKRTYVGANLFSDLPMVYVRVTCSRAVTGLPRIAGEIARLLPAVLDEATRVHSGIAAWVRDASEDSALPSGAVEQFRHLLRLSIALQNIVGGRLPVDAGIVRAAGDVFELLVPFESEYSAHGALELVLSLAAAASSQCANAGADLDPVRLKIERFFSLAPARSLDQTTAAIVRAARRRGIPAFRPSRWERIVRLGEGARQRRIHETYTDATPALAARMARSKRFCRQLLADVGIPVPVQISVFSDRMVAAAVRKVGFPLVVKPNGAGKGRGVTANVRSSKHLDAALRRAWAVNRQGLVLESYIEGSEYRILVVDGRVLAAARRVPAGVIGDGRHDIAELVRLANLDERRGRGFERVLTRIELDAEVERVLMDQGLSPDHVPASGRFVQLRQTANISTGGTGEDVTDLMHPEVAEIARESASVLGLDIAGVDYITPDISRAPGEVGGAVIEVNQCPGLRPHWSADCGRRNLVDPILDYLFPAGTDGRIAVVQIYAGSRVTRAPEFLFRMLHGAGHKVGMVSGAGSRVHGRPFSGYDTDDGYDVQRLLGHPGIDAAIAEVSCDRILRHGLPVDSSAVAAVIGGAAATAGGCGGEIAALVGRSARGALVVNADDPVSFSAAGMAREGCSVVLVANDASSPAVARHVRAGGVAVVPGPGAGFAGAVLLNGRDHRQALPFHDRVAGSDPIRADLRVDILAAIAIARVVGVDPALAASACVDESDSR